MCDVWFVMCTQSAQKVAKKFTTFAPPIILSTFLFSFCVNTPPLLLLYHTFLHALLNTYCHPLAIHFLQYFLLLFFLPFVHSLVSFKGLKELLLHTIGTIFKFIRHLNSHTALSCLLNDIQPFFNA